MIFRLGSGGIFPQLPHDGRKHRRRDFRDRLEMTPGRPGAQLRRTVLFLVCLLGNIAVRRRLQDAVPRHARPRRNLHRGNPEKFRDILSLTARIYFVY